MELDYSVSFAEQYEIEPQEYVDVAVTALPFSTRLVNRFRSNKIQTIADLALKTPNDLMQINGFGKNSLAEICSFFSSISDENTVCPLHKKPFHYDIKVEHESQISINSFNTDDSLNKQEQNIVSEACEVLGTELVEKCKSSPKSIRDIVLMLQEFCINTARLSEFKNLMDNIPKYRRQSCAIYYINAYTQDETKRNVLISQYSSKNANLDQLIGNDLDNQTTCAQVKRFLKWCAFDLKKDVTTLINAIAEQKKLLTIIEMRARKFTLEKCGNKLHITRERVRQLESKALRIFARYQSRIKLIAKISAEKNGASIITPADIERYSGDYSTELLFLLQ